jgi:hypothetical protein
MTVPSGTLEQAAIFYAGTLGFTRVAVPVLQKDTLAWSAPFPFPLPSLLSNAPLPPDAHRFDITPAGQQIHISAPSSEGTAHNDPAASRHPCFKLESPAALLALQRRIYAHFEGGAAAAPMAADKPGEEASGAFSFRVPGGAVRVLCGTRANDRCCV